MLFKDIHLTKKFNNVFKHFHVSNSLPFYSKKKFQEVYFRLLHRILLNGGFHNRMYYVTFRNFLSAYWEIPKVRTRLANFLKCPAVLGQTLQIVCEVKSTLGFFRNFNVSAMCLEKGTFVSGQELTRSSMYVPIKMFVVKREFCGSGKCIVRLILKINIIYKFSISI